MTEHNAVRNSGSWSALITCIAAWCFVLQRVALCCNVIALREMSLHCALRRTVLQRVALCRNMLHCERACTVLQGACTVFQRGTPCCNMLALRGNVLHCVCNVLSTEASWYV